MFCEETGLFLFHTKKEIARQINKHHRTRFRDNSFFFLWSGEESHKEEDMPITRRAFDVEFKLHFSRNTLHDMEVLRWVYINYSIFLTVVA